MNKHKVRQYSIICAILFLVSIAVFAGNKSGKEINVQVISTETNAVVDKSDQKTDVQTTSSDKDIPANRAGEEINWQVISSGGNMNGSSTNYGLSSTVAQTAVGSGTSASYGLGHGFWQGIGSGSCCDLAGDVNNDTNIDILDIVFVINFKYKGGPAPECMDEANINSDTEIDILDIVYLINYKYKGGPTPICGTSGEK
ncbi:dockerin type I domain-containing protein [Neptuniibacter sp.]|uniref:dockerin type I domain-containing protein n=1 Tax=Neptuniibacter sp. TaxID=1962643 RepID=UPI00260BE831|nr:dockerin type I domain-containing protein [Neptuniibacter sp.]MCP4597329.1 hypothetical protein [Neptuniibacter sp.]